MSQVSLEDFLDEPEPLVVPEEPENEPIQEKPLPQIHEKVTPENMMNVIMKNLHKLSANERTKIMQFFNQQQNQAGDPKQRLREKMQFKRNQRTKKNVVMKKLEQDDKHKEDIQKILEKLNIKM